MSSRVDEGKLSESLSTLNISDINETLTLSYMLAHEPWMWHELPPQYHNSKEHPRPRFSYGIEVSFEEVEKFALELLPQLESYFDEAPDAACNAICIHFNDVCGKTRSMGFTFEGVYSKKAEFMFALANTHEKRIDERRVHEVGKKLLERLGKIGWGHKTLKWSNDYEGMEREDWSDSTVIVEQ